MSWWINLPGQPPSSNSMYERNSWNRGQHKKAGVEAYQAGVTHIVRAARPSGWQMPQGLLTINYYFNVAHEIDCTNAIKVIEDAIAMALCLGSNPPRCCTALDRWFLPRAMGKIINGKLKPYVLVEIAG